MRPLLPPPSYFDPAVFAEEQRGLFARVWQFAGFAADVAAPNDFITVEVAGRSVVVQNFDGELHAFANVCSHRFARIRCEASGNGKLQCPYHGWIYNSAGVPYSIPSRPRFDDLKDRDEVQKLALAAYSVARCGGLIFVRESADGPALREFLGDSWEMVERMSLALGERVYRNDMLFRCNWKVALENGLEAYHVGFVHENTFKTLGTSGMDFRFAGCHSTWYADVEPHLAARMQKLAAVARMPWPQNGYVHHFIFPNVTVSSVCGTAFGFQVLTPVSAGETRLTAVVFLSRLEADPSVNAMVTELLGPSASSFTLEVAQEDQSVCEAVQLGLPEATQPGILSEEEERVFRFQQAYATHALELPAVNPPRGSVGL